MIDQSENEGDRGDRGDQPIRERVDGHVMICFDAILVRVELESRMEGSLK